MIVDSGEEWTFDKIEEIYENIKRIADDKFGLNYFPNQLEVISSEQMLDAYASVGMPVYYPHWSFGEQFVKEQEAYKRGRMGLAYEIVINSNPCIAYLMEENTMLMQTLVIAHASFGHNHFFKNNFLFKQWTDPDGIIDYLVFAKKYIRQCEEKYGEDTVEEVLDAAHALSMYGVDKYKRPSIPSAAQEEARRQEREEFIHSQLNRIWETIPNTKKEEDDEKEKEPNFPSEPQENLLYFLEKNAPKLEGWKREILRIVRKISQYFYPQRQLQLMNEGCATFFHYKIIHELEAEGILTNGAMMEFYHSHTGVIYQPDAVLDNGKSNPRYSGINPYALGLAMYQDIERVAMDPTEEDRDWFGKQDWVGSGDWLGTIKWAIESFKDESFVKQFLSPKVMRDFQMFAMKDDEEDPMIEITGIHNKQGYKTIRDTLSRQYNLGYRSPDVQVTKVDRWGDRSITLQHFMVNGRPLEPNSALDTLKYIESLWGYNVKLEAVDENKEIRSIIDLREQETIVDIFLKEE